MYFLQAGIVPPAGGVRIFPAAISEQSSTLTGIRQSSAVKVSWCALAFSYFFFLDFLEFSAAAKQVEKASSSVTTTSSRMEESSSYTSQVVQSISHASSFAAEVQYTDAVDVLCKYAFDLEALIARFAYSAPLFLPARMN